MGKVTIMRVAISVVGVIIAEIINEEFYKLRGVL